jgi:hypothetical protein
MNDTYKVIRAAFSKELETDGDIWRILRRITLVDLTKLSFFYFQKNGNTKYLIDVFNYSMKLKLLSRINPIEIDGTLTEVNNRFNREQGYILDHYDAIFSELEKKIKNNTSASIYNLNEKIQYIKVVNELKIDSYSDDIFEEIICITFNLLNSDSCRNEGPK